MSKAIVLLSGGLDSCVTAAIAKAASHQLHFLNVYYGQRHSRERDSATAIAAAYESQIDYLDITRFATMLGHSTVLTDKTREVPMGRSEQEMSNGKAPSYVPGRNTIMLALAQSLAEAVEADVIYCGVNAVDYSGYVDCRPAFITAWNELAQVATFRGVEGRPIWIEAPLIQMTKVQIVQKGLELEAPMHLSWSCYNGGRFPCNFCDSCQIRNAAFEALGQIDPWVRANANPV